MARTRFTVKEGLSVADDNAVGGYPLIPVGGLMPYAGATSPEGWLLCDGSAINRTTYANLFALIGTTYGSGNGTTTFNVPDMRSRIPMGAGAGTGLTSRALAATGGAESVVIASGNLPTHVHSVDPPNTTSGNDNTEHTHSIDPPNTGSGTVSSDHAHGFSTGDHYHGVTGNSGAHEHRLYFVTDAGSGTARARVSASGSSLSNYGISEYTGGHDHGTSGASTSGTTGGINANHTHALDIGAFNSGGRSAYHQHDVNIGPFDSGNGGFANTALGLMNPFLALNYIIKY
jgi:microcystin-dependent protein